MTSLFDGLVAGIIAVILNVVVIAQIRFRAHPQDAHFLVKVYVWTVLLRYGLAVVLNALVLDSSFAAAFWGDSSTYDSGGYQLALQWTGESIGSLRSVRSISGYGWIYFVGAVYSLMGRNQLLIQFLNGLIGGLTVLVIYAIASRLFDRTAARWAALFMAFFPQMLFWSAGLYKDPSTLLCIALCMYAVLCLRERLSLGSILLFVASLLVLVTLRFYVAYFVGFAALATFAFVRQAGRFRLLVTYGMLLGMLILAFSFAVERDTLERQASYMNLQRLQTTREDQATWGQSGFGQEYDVSTPAGALAALPVGLTYLLLAPFPWAISSVRQALVLPEMLVWYALLPAFVRGLRYAVRTRFGAVLPIVVFAATLTGAYALMQGNVGTAYRQRTQVSMFFFIFMGVGIVEKRRQRALVHAPGSTTSWPQAP